MQTDFGGCFKVQKIDLKKEKHQKNEFELFFDVCVKIKRWESYPKNEIFKAITNVEIRAIFISPSSDCIIAPYDGGIDIIVDSTEIREELKIKYSSWLSENKDGLKRI